MTPVDFANALLANAYPPRATCNYADCDDDAVTAGRCAQHHDVRCGGCSQPATRRDAYDVADVCDYCGEMSDRRRAEATERVRRDEMREAYGDYLRDEGKDRRPW